MYESSVRCTSGIVSSRETGISGRKLNRHEIAVCVCEGKSGMNERGALEIDGSDSNDRQTDRQETRYQPVRRDCSTNAQSRGQERAPTLTAGIRVVSSSSTNGRISITQGWPDGRILTDCDPRGGVRKTGSRRAVLDSTDRIGGLVGRARGMHFNSTVCSTLDLDREGRSGRMIHRPPVCAASSSACGRCGREWWCRTVSAT